MGGCDIGAFPRDGPQVDLADMLDVCVDTVRNWEMGRTEPGGEMVQAVEEAIESEVRD